MSSAGSTTSSSAASSSSSSSSSSSNSSSSSSDSHDSDYSNTKSTEERFRAYLKDALARIPEVSAQATSDQIEEWCRLLYNSMNTPNRLYHNAEHVLEVLEYLHQQEGPVAVNPISVLAVLFHDIVYYTLDKRLSFEQSVLLMGVLEEEPDGSVVLLPQKGNPTLEMVCYVFGHDFGADNQLPVTTPGLNEFLSALVAVQILREVLEVEQLLQMVVAIEATVPFRPAPSTHDALWQRTVDVYLAGVCNGDEGCLPLAQKFATRALQQACLVANSDLGVFSCKDPLRFVDTNWRLLPEWFPKLLPLQQGKTDDAATLADLQHALACVLGRPMDTGRIFSYFQNYPDEETLQAKIGQANRLMAFLKSYMAIRILTLQLIQQVARLLASGDDAKGPQIRLVQLAEVERAATAPLLEENPEQEQPTNAEEGTGAKELQQSATPTTIEAEDGTSGDNSKDSTNGEESQELKLDQIPDELLLLQVLTEGRGVDYAWDAKASPLAACLYQELLDQPASVREHLDSHRELLLHDNSKAAWLQTLPPASVRKAIKGVVAVLKPSANEWEEKLTELVFGSAEAIPG